MADSISDALLSLALDRGQRLSTFLQHLAVEGLAQEHEIAPFRALAHLLVRQHAHPPPQDEPQHYTSALRRMLTGDTGVLALLDALPMDRKGYDPQQLLAMERRFSGWRWKLRARSDRLRSVHHGLALEQILVLPEGEVILFDPVLELGDPAADVSAIAVELLALGAREPLCWPDGYKLLFDAFWSTYLAASGDYELLDVAPPFLAWRALQVAAVLPLGPRAKLFSFAEEVLAQTSFDPDEMRWMSR